MSPNIVGFAVGTAFIVPTIYLFQVKKIEARMWPFFLATLPTYYMLFGLLVMDIEVVLKEALYGLPFITSGLIVWKIKSYAALVITAFGWLAHGIYDYYHDFFFVNSGVFEWYPAFCALVDIVVSLYLLSQGRRILQESEHPLMRE
jgi:hypothetical protein